MEHKAKKLVIITEKVISTGVTDVIDSCGATGYTIVSVGGKGEHGMRSDGGVAGDSFSNVKIEVIVPDTKVADEIAGKVADKYFENYSGITYAEDVEILRPQKF